MPQPAGTTGVVGKAPNALKDELQYDPMVDKSTGSDFGGGIAPDSNYSLVFNATSDYMLLLKVESDNVFRIVLANQAYVSALQHIDPNVTRERLEGLSAGDFAVQAAIPQETYAAIVQSYNSAVASSQPVILEERVEIRGRLFYLQSSYTPILDQSGECTHVLYVGRDITRQKESEEELRGLLEERNVLIHELFHRTRNNMTVISSIFSLYSADGTPQETPIIVADVAEKIQAMSAVHGRLYQSSDLGHLSLSDVVQDIAAIVKAESAATRREVRVDIRGEAQITIEVALPLSLVIQQILSTALRLPISKGHTGRVVVAVGGDSTAIRVEVESDTANQISENDLRDRTGLRMIREIVIKQLYGELLEPETSETEPPRWRLRVPVKDRPD